MTLDEAIAHIEECLKGDTFLDPLDDDDSLTREALERLCNFAKRISHAYPTL